MKGKEPLDAVGICPECGGFGYYQALGPGKPILYYEPCPQCDGSGAADFKAARSEAEQSQ